MKISKKVLSMVLCGFIVLGGSQVSLINAHAQSYSTTSIQNSTQWRQTIRFKLRAKWNTLYKAWWSIDLVYKNGHLTLEGPTNIPGNLTFDDTFVFVKLDERQKHNQTITKFRPSHNLSAGDALKRAIDLFNKAGVHDTDYIFIYGEDWNDTFEYSYVNHVIKQTSNNDYSRGFHNVVRGLTGFKVSSNGLEEHRFYR